ncbi:MAG: branched-chain amino acid transaminase [Conexivisphaerales archaeon]
MADQKADYVWFNGKLVPWEDAKVHVLTHAFNYGTAAFEGIRAYPYNDEMYIFRLREHLQRLQNSCKVYGFKLDYTLEQLEEACKSLIRENRFHVKTYIRPLVYVAGVGVGIGFPNQPIGVAIAAVPFDVYFKEGSGVHAMVSSWRRIHEESLPPSAKIAGHYANSVLAKMHALENGYGEAIMLDAEGNVSEGTGENIFIVRDSKLITPSLSSGILEGITRKTVMELAQEEGIEVVEREVTRVELYTSEEAFFTGTAAEITPILSVDKRPVGDGKPGKITRRMIDLYAKAVVGKLEGHEDWVTPVYRKVSAGESRRLGAKVSQVS